jgi:hypothetical protein
MRKADNNESALPLIPADNEQKDFMLPLVFYKRFSDVCDDEFVGHEPEFGDEEVSHEIIGANKTVYQMDSADFRLLTAKPEGSSGSFIGGGLWPETRGNPEEIHRVGVDKLFGCGQGGSSLELGFSSVQLILLKSQRLSGFVQSADF